MIQANELRIGNWVDKSNIAKYKHVGKVMTLSVTNKFDPVLLTEEILEKAGFDNCFLDIGDQAIEVRKGVFYLYGSTACTHGHTFSGEVKYLHQLQNLYFALTGEELKIEL